MTFLHYFLGIKMVTLPNKNLLLTQSKYIRDLLIKVGMDSDKPITFHTLPSYALSTQYLVPYDKPSFYRSIIWALWYVTLTRVDIIYAINKICQFISNP